MLRVGLTGNIASGKSSVARVWERCGAVVIDADALSRRAVEPGMPALDRIVEAFGEDVRDASGRLDRAALRDRVFRDAAARRRLESIVHPEVARLRREEEQAAEQAGTEIVVHDIPLLFEVEMEDAFDLVVLVDAPPELRLRRLVRDRGIDEAGARRMIDAQMPSGPKWRRADIVIENTGTLDDLERRARSVWEALERRATSSG